jgi:hypothetical protein
MRMILLDGVAPCAMAGGAKAAVRAPASSVALVTSDFRLNMRGAVE